jgi:ribosome-associated translation inhibitor RaiA
MQLPLQVSFRHMEGSPVLEAIIREKAAKLDTFAARIMSCRVVVEPSGKHRRNGNEYGVRIDIKLPMGEVATTRKQGGRKESKDIRVAIREAFDAAARQLEDYVRMQRGDVKAHLRRDAS